MKKTIFLLVALCISILNYAQTAYNPFAQNIHFTPEPNVYGFQNCSEAYAKFNFGLTTQANAQSFATQPLKINICLQGFLPSNTNMALVVYGSQAQYFQWTYNILTNCIQGVQIDTLFGTGNNIFNLEPRSFGDIGVKLQIAPYLPVPATLKVDVNLDVPPYMQVGNTSDDHEFVQTQNYIGVTTVTGKLFLDTASSPTPAGLPNGRPDGTPMYINVIDNLTGLVEDNVLIDSGGTYFVDSLRPERSYKITLSTIQGINGQPAPPVSLPANWGYSSEDCCDNIGSDGNPDGMLSTWANTCAVINANFAIANPLFTESYEQFYMNVALAVNQLNFQIIENDCNALLFWNKTGENQYVRYEIMHKEGTGGSFSKIGEINVVNNTPDDYQYTFMDKNDFEDNKIYHYQLRMIDINQRIFISPTKTFSLSCSGKNPVATIYPNPASDNINFLYDNTNTSESIALTVMDIAGKVLISKTRNITAGQNNLNMEISNLPAGYYFLKYQDQESFQTGTLKFSIYK